MKENKATAEWLGSLKEGKGTFSTGSGAISEANYNFGSRFANELGTNPEEMIAAAHAACFSMAVSAELGKLEVVPNSVKTVAIVSLDLSGDAPTVKSSHLEVEGDVPEGAEDKFRQAAETAKKGCPISRLLNAEITLDVKVVS